MRSVCAGPDCRCHPSHRSMCVFTDHRCAPSPLHNGLRRALLADQAVGVQQEAVGSIDFPLHGHLRLEETEVAVIAPTPTADLDDTESVHHSSRNTDFRLTRLGAAPRVPHHRLRSLRALYRLRPSPLPDIPGSPRRAHPPHGHRLHSLPLVRLPIPPPGDHPCHILPHSPLGARGGGCSCHAVAGLEEGGEAESGSPEPRGGRGSQGVDLQPGGETDPSLCFCSTCFPGSRSREGHSPLTVAARFCTESSTAPRPSREPGVSSPMAR